jgi:hypothetical protein
MTEMHCQCGAILEAEDENAGHPGECSSCPREGAARGPMRRSHWLSPITAVCISVGVMGLMAAGCDHGAGRSDEEQNATTTETDGNRQADAGVARVVSETEMLRQDFARRTGIEQGKAESLALEYIKGNLNDPDSIKNVDCSVSPCKSGGREGYWVGTLTFQAKNSFGGYVKGYVSVKGKEHEVINAIEGYDDYFIPLVEPALKSASDPGHWYYP